ncbi:trypco2 family protein [Kribbella sp. NPDC051952]|uniref:trypco2 family protein n=1 Tax=Kribbella sp. NPDC051952 TaxID=3154851 RepID=UPI003412F517
MVDQTPIQLDEWLESLRGEFAAALRRGRGHEIRFVIDKVELEVEVQSHREAGAEGRIRFWVVDAAAEGKRGSSRTHRLRIAVTPVMDDGSSLQVRDDLDGPPE